MSLSFEHQHQQLSFPIMFFPIDSNCPNERAAWIREVALSFPAAFATPLGLREICTNLWQAKLDQDVDSTVGVSTGLRSTLFFLSRYPGDALGRCVPLTGHLDGRTPTSSLCSLLGRCVGAAV
jgi:hypothetical protein